MSNKWEINISITVSDAEQNKKTYMALYFYDGDPKKLDISTYLNQWFIENNIDKSCLDNFSCNVWKNRSDELVRW